MKIQKAIKQRIRLFKQFSHHPLLRNHKLQGKYAGYRSINATGDWRIIFREDKQNNVIVLESLGTHSQLYN